ncbi:MAG: guanitoxin biosynthesis heme-dependent pre-guanitoxin N-hydroxylase GntA [Gemmatimonadaceae bacterium]
MPSAALTARVHAGFLAFVGDERFSCLAGKGVVHRGAYTLRVYSALGSADTAPALGSDLAAFVARPPATRDGFTTFVAVFTGRAPRSEGAFERRLWTQLQLLHGGDDAGWDPTVSADTDDPRFSFSFASQAFFVVGLHPKSSRITRRFRWPALVFNPRRQFDQLRADGRFDRLRTAIREREIALQGSINPTLADFGVRSEARQYSGRAAEPEWRCPFHARPRDADGA